MPKLFVAPQPNVPSVQIECGVYDVEEPWMGIVFQDPLQNAGTVGAEHFPQAA